MLKRRQDYQPPAFLVISVFITIDIKDDATDVTTNLAVRRNPDAAADAPLWLDGQNIELTRLAIDSVELPIGQDMPDGVDVSDHGLSIAGLADEAVVEAQSRCYPQDNTALEGLYL